VVVRDRGRWGVGVSFHQFGRVGGVGKIKDLTSDVGNATEGALGVSRLGRLRTGRMGDHGRQRKDVGTRQEWRGGEGQG